MARRRLAPTAALRQVFDDLVRFETMLWTAIDERLRSECGLNLASFNAMLIIEQTPACRVLDIAQAVAITVGGASQAVDRLERAGWCARKANPADRRSSVLELTPDGRRLLDRASPVFDQELDRLLRAPLPVGDLDRLRAILGALRNAAGAEHASATAQSAPGRTQR